AYGAPAVDFLCSDRAVVFVVVAVDAGGARAVGAAHDVAVPYAQRLMTVAFDELNDRGVRRLRVGADVGGARFFHVEGEQATENADAFWAYGPGDDDEALMAVGVARKLVMAVAQKERRCLKTE